MAYSIVAMPRMASWGNSSSSVPMAVKFGIGDKTIEYSDSFFLNLSCLGIFSFVISEGIFSFFSLCLSLLLGLCFLCSLAS